MHFCMCQLGRKIMLISFTTNIKFIFDVIFFTGSNIVKRLREKLFSSVMRQEMGFFDILSSN
jgi:hypothetical protein